jgi:hypothetical protein
VIGTSGLDSGAGGPRKNARACVQSFTVNLTITFMHYDELAITFLSVPLIGNAALKLCLLNKALIHVH